MSKRVRFLSILLILAALLSFALGGLFFYAATHTLDGDFGLYAAQVRYACVCLAAGLLCLAVRYRIRRR